MNQRRAELIAAAVAGDLDDAEAAELRALAAADPGVEAEIAELRMTAEHVAALQEWRDVEVSDALRSRVLGAAADEDVITDGEPGRTHSRWWLAAGAAACVAIGVVGAVSVANLRSSPPSGPPGTLGAVEHIEFSGEPEGVTMLGDLVAHTWGTETILEIAGLPAGERYAVVLVARDGDVYESGTFLGSEVTIDCRMNAALLRPEVADVEIRDDEGAVIGVAHAPTVS